MSDEAIEAARRLLAEALPLPEPGPDADPLAGLLYERWFHATTGARRRYPDPSAYRAVALEARPFEAGWTVEAIIPGAVGAVRLRRGDTLREAPPLAWAPETPPRISPSVGDAARAAPLRDGPQGGFWHLWSPMWPKRTPRRLWRWYLQVAEGAELAAAAVVAAHAPARRAWASKLLAGEHLAGRRDVAVLYAPVAEEAWLAALFDALAPQLDDRPGPPFTLPVRDGVSRAEDPGGGVSFGQRLCGLIAAAARGAPEALDDPEAWRETVARRFAEAGLTPEATRRGRDGG